jgi:UPF0271 protein
MAKKLLIIDSSAVIMGYNPLGVSAKQYTTSTVIDEVRQNTVSYTRLKLALDTGKLRLYDPSIECSNEVKEASRRTGDLAVLSPTDIEILAVALELTRIDSSPILVSDDYTIQNVATFLGIDYCSLTTFGIRYRFQWLWYCPACKKRFVPNVSLDTSCDVCGTQLKRRVLKKRLLKNE